MDRITAEIIKELVESSSSDDGDEILEMILDFSSDDSEEDHQKHELSEHFMNLLDAYSESDFKSHFGLERSTIEKLTIPYSKSEFTPVTTHRGKSKIGPRKEMYMYVWYISNTITFRELGELFGVPKSSGWTAVQRVSSWLVADCRRYVKWPQGALVAENCLKFESQSRIPDILGAIGCTHVKINAPKIDKKSYANGKKSFTIALQAVVDADKRFIDICCGEPGSFHDSIVLESSPLFRKAENNCIQLFPSNTFILGHSAYPAQNWLVTPFTDNGSLTEQQMSFNELHSSTRNIVKTVFSLLKSRFKRLLHFSEQRCLESVIKIVVSACILHNICISLNDEYLGEIEDEEENFDLQNNSSDSLVDFCENRRQMVFKYLIDHKVI
ncbi:uncharacterized protein LOC129906532 [Episyrphus balteatus]|uniref:uncharacterized protein LOC129906532 n=1 Tax=Episyrphus balteatus TaxID=286459 RepID=UPI002486B9CE|nr:uncharacterized protein LOC129906532 [Episyrphus balteatus]